MRKRQYIAGTLLLSYALALLGSALFHDHSSHAHSHAGCSHENQSCKVDVTKTSKKKSHCCHHHHKSSDEAIANSDNKEQSKQQQDQHHDHENCQICQFLATPLLASPAITITDASTPLIEECIFYHESISDTCVLLPCLRGPPAVA